MPGTLSRDRIIDVALDLSAREGIEALSMRRIAAELGTGAMSLYNHVPDKASLLTGLADRVLGEVEIPDGASWRQVAESWATSLRSTLLAHVHVVPIVIRANDSQPLLGTSQALTVALIAAGLGEDEARNVTRVVGRLVAGSVFLDAGFLRLGRGERASLDEHYAFGLGCLLDGLERRVGTAGARRAAARR